MTTVYFVCIGNTCRSPIAAELFNQKLQAYGIEGIRAESFGISPFYADSEEVRRLREAAVVGVTGRINGLKRHRPRGIGDISFSDGDKIVLLDGGSVNELLSGIKGNPSFKNKKVPVIIIDIQDPFGGGLKDYIECCLELEEALEESLDLLIGGVCA
ncbi:MAG: hypothetical protein QW505_04255 [Thermoplasmata archaeon]